MDELEEKTEGYDFLIIDECHQVPTVTFEPVLKSIKARYVLGLTATPQRKDRFESIIFMQCGRIAHTIEDINLQSQDRKVFFRSTKWPEFGNALAVLGGVPNQATWMLAVLAGLRILRRYVNQPRQGLIKVNKS